MSKNEENSRLLESAKNLDNAIVALESLSNLLKDLRSTIEDTTKKTVSEVNSTFQVSKLGVDNFKNEIENNIESQKGVIETASSQTAKTIEELTLAYSSDLLDAVTQNITAFQSFATKLSDGQEKDLVDRVTEIRELIDTTISGHAERTTGIETQMVQTSSEFPEAVRNHLQTLTTAMEQELRQILKIKEEVLTETLSNLQQEFRERVTSQIGQVFDGITRMKAQLQEIVEDTLNQLRENLMRINEGIDQYFLEEVNRTQDILVEYEGNMLDAIKQVAEAYEHEADRLIKVLREQSSQHTDEIYSSLTQDATSFKTSITKKKKKYDEEIRETRLKAFQSLDEVKETIITQQGLIRDDLTDKVRKLLEDIKKLSTTQNKEIQEKIDAQLAEIKAQIEANAKESITAINSQYQALTKDLKNGEVSITGKIGSLKKTVNDTLEAKEKEISKSVSTARKELEEAKKKL